jgi:hypothetical protein
MSNTYKFVYESAKQDDLSEFPKKTSIKAVHEFDEDITWVPILANFCDFLEGIGYVGVSQKIVIKDKFGLMGSGLFFETIKEAAYDEEDFDLDEEEEDDEENEDFQDMKKEVA